MPTVERLAATTPPVEPVALALLEEWVRVDAGQDTLVLTHVLTAAREQVESYTGRYFAGGQRLAFTFELGEAYQLPEGAVVESVSGFFITLEKLHAWSLEEYRKGIVVSRDLPWGVAVRQTYTVTTTLPADTNCPELAKSAILELAAEWYKNRESSMVGTIAPPIPVGWRVKLASLRLNPLI